jgi:site-specific DNA-methyltransferase (adenine-specific)
MPAVDGEAGYPPGARIIWEKPGQGSIPLDSGKGRTRPDSAPAHRVILDVSDQTWGLEGMSYFLLKGLAVVRGWSRRRELVSARAEEELTPAPRWVISAAAEHRDQVIPPLRRRWTHLHTHRPTVPQSCSMSTGLRFRCRRKQPAQRSVRGWDHGPALAKLAGGRLPSPGSGEVILADNLDVLRKLPSESLDLVYIDPPFATGQVRRLDAIRTGSGEGRRRGFAGREYQFEVISRHSYRDDRGLEAHLEFLRLRLVEIHRALRAHGSLYLHLDYRTAHHVRLLLDQIFGPERFLNEIIWAYDYGGRQRDRWPRKHDTILWYSKSNRWIFERSEIARIPYMAPGLVGPEKAARGKLPTDTWWLTIVPTRSAERTGYPTQKPIALLERIVRASSREGDLVADFFCGSGTTGVVAQAWGRRYLLVDDNPTAVEITRKRLGMPA